MDGAISQKLRLAVKSKLTTLDAYIDDELPDLILVMVARKRAKDDMITELEPFLDENAATFIEWLDKLMMKLKSISGAKTAGGLPTTAITKTVAKRMASSDSSKSRSRSRSRSKKSRSNSSDSSSRSRSQSRSRNRNTKKKSDAFDHSGRRRGMELAKTYRNSSSEGSNSKGLYERRKKQKRSERSRDRDRKEAKRRRRRSRSRSNTYDRQLKQRDEENKIRREASHERKLKIAEENVNSRILAIKGEEEGDGDNYGWAEGSRIKPMVKKINPEEETKKLIEAELEAIENEKAIQEQHKANLLKEAEMKKQMKMRDRDRRNRESYDMGNREDQDKNCVEKRPDRNYGRGDDREITDNRESRNNREDRNNREIRGDRGNRHGQEVRCGRDDKYNRDPREGREDDKKRENRDHGDLRENREEINHHGGNRGSRHNRNNPEIRNDRQDINSREDRHNRESDRSNRKIYQYEENDPHNSRDIHRNKDRSFEDSHNPDDQIRDRNFDDDRYVDRSQERERRRRTPEPVQPPQKKHGRCSSAMPFLELNNKNGNKKKEFNQEEYDRHMANSIRNRKAIGDYESDEDVDGVPIDKPKHLNTDRGKVYQPPADYEDAGQGGYPGQELPW